MKFNVKFTKVQNNHNQLRSDEITGWTNALPEVGRYFEMLAPPFDPEAGVRCVNTSEVMEITEMTTGVEDEPTSLTFKTRSGSIYRVEVLTP